MNVFILGFVIFVLSLYGIFLALKSNSFYSFDVATLFLVVASFSVIWFLYFYTNPAKPDVSLDETYIAMEAICWLAYFVFCLGDSDNGNFKITST